MEKEDLADQRHHRRGHPETEKLPHLRPPPPTHTPTPSTHVDPGPGDRK